MDSDALVVVANRLPVERDDAEGWRLSPGGLVSALVPVLGDTSATWIGWNGMAGNEVAPAEAMPEEFGGIRMVAVPLTQEDVELHYEGFSNGAIWPLYHDCVATPSYHRIEYDAYARINAQFALSAEQECPEGARVWVHDYQLQLVPGLLRTSRPDLQMGFFLHIPFPPVELFAQLPWREQILRGLLGADVVGFQTSRDARSFLAATETILGLRPGGDRVDVEDGSGHRTVHVQAFPIGIDAAAFAARAADPIVLARARQIREEIGAGSQLLLGVDRLDYTKGIAVRLRAFGEVLHEESLDVTDVTMLQVAVPSRQNIDEYQRVRDDVELLVGRVNGDVASVGRPVVHYLHRPVDRDELVAMYVAADVLVVTPLRDGMNLVAKEFVACRAREDGGLVLSEFTGAAHQLDAAYLVNPYDVDAVKRALVAAVRAAPDEQQRRMRLLRANVFENDVTRWAETFLATLDGADGT